MKEIKQKPWLDETAADAGVFFSKSGKRKVLPFSEGFLLINNGLFNSTVRQLWELHAPFFITGSRGEELQIIFGMN